MRRRQKTIRNVETRKSGIDVKSDDAESGAREQPAKRSIRSWVEWPQPIPRRNYPVKIEAAVYVAEKLGGR